MAEESDVRLGSTVRSRTLGAELRSARKRSGVDKSELLAMLGVTAAWLSKLEQGERGTDARNVARLLGAYRTDRKTAQRLLEMHADPRDWFLGCGHGAGGVDEVAALLLHETHAKEVFCYEAVSLPALAQTREYARMMFARHPLAQSIDIGRRVQAREHRQQVLRSARPSRFVFVMREATLRNLPGDRSLVAGQLRHLATLPNTGRVTVRVIPSAVDAVFWEPYSFALMTSDRFRPVVHVDAMHYSLFLDARDEVEAYRDAARRVTDNAASQEESLALILHLANNVRPADRAWAGV